MTRFGDFAPLCTNTPSYTWCNLFYHQILKHDPSVFTGASADQLSAPVGVNPKCGIARMGNHGEGKSLGNIANIIACGLSIIAVALMIASATRRRAAVGRIELRMFFILYLITLPLQLVTNGAILEQGTKGLTIVTAIHAGFVAALFWALVSNALVATQWVEDGTLSSMIPYYIGTIAFFVATLYIALDVGLTITSTFGPSNPLIDLHSIPLFVFTNIWPGAAALIYLIIMSWVVLAVLNEVRPMWWYLLAGVLFVLSQLAWYLLGKVICNGSNNKVDGSFVATILETMAVGALYMAWKSITEDSWEDDGYYS